MIKIILSVMVAASASVSLVAGGDRQPPRRLTLFLSADVAGNFEPCGCDAGPNGGLARRAGVVEDYRSQHPEAVIQVDAGNYFHAPGPEAGPINELMRESLGAFPIHVLNLASEDLHYWKELQGEESLGTQVISSNLVPRRSGTPRPAQYALVDIPAAKVGLGRDLRIGFLGVTDPARVKPNSGFKAIDPLQAIEQLKAEVMERADFLIVLADIPRQANELPADSLLRRIAADHPEVAAVLHTEKRYVLYPPQIVNNAVVLAGVERGRQLPRLTLVLDEQGKVAEIDHEWIDLKAGVRENAYWRAKQETIR